MKKRLLSILLIIVLALALVPAASAQDDCLGLSAADCDALLAGYAGLADVTSFVQTFSITFTATNLEILAMLAPGAPAAITFNLTGSGPFVFTDMGDVPVNLSADMVVSASGLGDEPLTNVPLTVALVDGILYLPLGDGGSLVGMPVEVVAESAGDAAGGLGLPIDPSDLAGGDMGGADLGNLGDLLGDGAADLEALSEFATYTRMGDDFAFNFDLGAFLASPEFSQVMGMAGALAGDDPDVAMTLGMAQGLLMGVVANIGVVQNLNTAAGIVDGLTFTTDVALDLGALFGMQDMPPMNISLVFNVEISEINANLTVVAPDAPILTPEETRELLGN